MEANTGTNPEGTNPEESDQPAIDNLKAWFAANREMLAEAGVDHIEAEYSGCGDEGHYNGASIYMVDETRLRYRLPKDVDQMLEEVYDEVAGNTKYEDGDGGQGTITLFVDSGRIKHESTTNEMVSRPFINEAL